MKLLATQSYEHTFEIEVNDNATDEEIRCAIMEKDYHFDGEWCCEWEKITEK